jgi:hypothetical protein
MKLIHCNIMKYVHGPVLVFPSSYFVAFARVTDEEKAMKSPPEASQT